MQEWRARISDCRGSGKTVLDWCKENGIKPKNYYYWEKQVIQEATQQCNASGRDEGTKLLIQVRPEQLKAEPVQQTGIVIRYGKATIELSTSTPADIVAELVSALNRHA